MSSYSGLSMLNGNTSINNSNSNVGQSGGASDK
jgi:hypothetical protein